MKLSRSWKLPVVATTWLTCTLFACLLVAAPKVNVVVGAQAPQLEQFAAREVADLLRRLFGAEVKLENRPSGDAEGWVFVGSPASSELIKSIAGATWPTKWSSRMNTSISTRCMSKRNA